MREPSEINPKTSKPVRVFWKVFFCSWGAVVLLILLIYAGLFGKLPSIQELQNPSMMSSSEIYADDGTLMGKFYQKDRINVKYQDISQNIIQALIATEDERFYQHSGIDIKSLMRAIIFLGSEGGASTITQQTAKALLGQESRKSVMRMIEKLKDNKLGESLLQSQENKATKKYATLNMTPLHQKTQLTHLIMKTKVYNNEHCLS